MSKWSTPFEALAEKMKQDIETVARKAFLDMYRSIVIMSPVETGRFQANWNPSYGSPNVTTTFDTGMTRALRKASAISKFPIGAIWYITNGLPYARRLEYGWSKQSPSGMVRVTALRFQEFVDRASR